MDTLYIVMPAYNEEANIEATVKQWYPVLKNGGEKSKLIIADSGSIDRTHAILNDLKKQYTQLDILTDTDKQHGPKLMALYSYAISEGADWIFQTDSDGQTNPEEFKEFWDDRNNYDCIIGNRSTRGDGVSRLLVEKVVCFMLMVIFGVRVPDANAPFRLMKSRVLEKYMCKLPDNYNIPNIMFTTFFSYYNENIDFRKISFLPRQGGKNSINLKKIIGIGWMALGDFIRIRKSL